MGVFGEGRGKGGATPSWLAKFPKKVIKKKVVFFGGK